MAKNFRLRLTMSRAETILGWLYFPVQLLVLPGLLHYGNALLPRPLSGTWVNIIFFVVNFLAVAVIFRSFLKRSLSQLGKQPGQFFRGSILGLALYWAANYALSFLLGKLAPGFSNLNDGAIVSMARSQLIPTAICTIFLVPVAEEALYRGLLFQGFYNRSHAAAYIISTVAFAAVHVWGYWGTADYLTLFLCFLQYIPAGLCLAWAYTEADNILAPILIHAIINAIGIYVMR